MAWRGRRNQRDDARVDTQEGGLQGAQHDIERPELSFWIDGLGGGLVIALDAARVEFELHTSVGCAFDRTTTFAK